MQIFVSQPMNCRSSLEIYKERYDYTQAFIDGIEYDGKIKIIDSIYDLGDVHPLVYLGVSLIDLSKADVVLMLPGWEKSRGCVVEHEAAVRYNIPIYYMNGELEVSI